MSIVKPAALAGILLCAVSTGALAASSKLQLILGGEAYDGPPIFEVSFDGQLLGEGTVSNAIDTAATGRFADAGDKTPYVQSFEFEVPEALFEPGGEVRVRLTNEAYGGEGSNHDRNLYLAAVTINGRAVTVSGLQTRGTKAGADQENELLGEFLVLRDGTMEGVSRAPAGGWPGPDTAVAQARAEVTPAVPVAEPPPVKPPVAVAALQVPESAEATPADAKPIEVAAVEPAALPVPATRSAACDRDELYNVIGFNESSNDLTPKLEARLKQIIDDIGPQKCKVVVTGYSSKQGNHATNALFAIERAQNVLTYLKRSGLSFEKATATGGGATEQFGEAFSANRRVVISVSP